MRPQSTFNGNYNYYYWRRYPNIRLLHQPGTQAYILLYIHSLHASVNNYMGFTSCYNQKAKRLFQYNNRLPFTLQIEPVKSPTQTISITRLQGYKYKPLPFLLDQASRGDLVRDRGTKLSYGIQMPAFVLIFY